MMDRINVLYLRQDHHGWYLEATLTLPQIINFDALMDVIKGLALPEGPERRSLMRRNRPTQPCGLEVLSPFLRVTHAARSQGTKAGIRFAAGTQDDVLDAAFGVACWMSLQLEVA